MGSEHSLEGAWLVAWAGEARAKGLPQGLSPQRADWEHHGALEG